MKNTRRHRRTAPTCTTTREADAITHSVPGWIELARLALLIGATGAALDG